MEDGADQLFVYGTLRHGQPARAMIAPYLVRWEPATTAGVLVAFPDYPAMTDGPGRILGERVWLRETAAAFARLDDYEGAEYRRVMRALRTPDGLEARAWCYVLADPALAKSGTPIPHGDWNRWLAERAS